MIIAANGKDPIFACLVSKGNSSGQRKLLYEIAWRVN